MAYARARPVGSWVDWPNTASLVRAQDLEKWDTALYLSQLFTGTSFFHVQDPVYGGAVGDGSVADTAKIQAVFDAAGQTGTVVYPTGTFKQRTINWRGQSVIGAGMYQTTIPGMPGLDVFHADPTLADSWATHPTLSGFTITVDDSIDNSAAFPQRGGVGNAGFAVDWPDRSTPPPLRFSDANVERIRIQGLSGIATGQNKSAGFYFQYPANICRFRDIWLYRLAYGYWDHYPTSNLVTGEFAADHNHWDSVYVNACSNAFRLVNAGFSTVTNLIMHGAGATGFQGVGVTSGQRLQPAHLVFDGVYSEIITTPWSLVGAGHSVHGMFLTGGSGPVYFDSDFSYYDTVDIATTPVSPILTVRGNYNDVNGLRRADSPTTSPGFTIQSGTVNSVKTMLGASTLPEWHLHGPSDDEIVVTPLAVRNDVGGLNFGSQFAGAANVILDYPGGGSLFFRRSGSASFAAFDSSSRMGVGVTSGLVAKLTVAGSIAETLTALAYSATIATDATLGNLFSITATNGTAFTISNPTGLATGQSLVYTIRNTSGGALGVITWGATFKMAAWTSPATGFSRSIRFHYDGTNLVEELRTPADVPN